MRRDPREDIYLGAAERLRHLASHSTRMQDHKFESPIERLGFEAVIVALICNSMVYELKLRTQAKVLDYRVDLLIEGHHGDWCIAVEWDGHNFHDRTKEQASRDRERDRRMQDIGIRVLRFTGSDVWNAPWHVAEEIISTAANIEMTKKNERAQRSMDKERGRD